MRLNSELLGGITWIKAEETDDTVPGKHVTLGLRNKDRKRFSWGLCKPVVWERGCPVDTIIMGDS